MLPLLLVAAGALAACFASYLVHRRPPAPLDVTLGLLAGAIGAAITSFFGDGGIGWPQLSLLVTIALAFGLESLGGRAPAAK